MSEERDRYSTRWIAYATIFGFLLGMTFSTASKVDDLTDRLDAIEKAIKVEAPAK